MLRMSVFFMFYFLFFQHGSNASERMEMLFRLSYIFYTSHYQLSPEPHPNAMHKRKEERT